MKNPLTGISKDQAEDIIERQRLQELEWQKTLASVPKSLRVLCDILCPEYTHPALEKLRTFSVGSFEKFTFPMIRAVWPSLLASDLVTVQPMSNQNAAVFYNNAPNTSPYRTATGNKMRENKYSNYIDKIQDYMRDQLVVNNTEPENLVDFRSTFVWTEGQKNFFYSLLVRNPFKFTNDEVSINVQYCYLMDLALETYKKLKNSNYLTNITDNEMYCQLTSMEILNPFPIEDNLTDSSQRDKHIWYVLTELLKYSMVGDINGSVSHV